MSWKRVILSSNKIESGLRSSMTLNLNNGMAADDINAKVDLLPRYIPYGKTLTIQFADGTYTLNKTLNFAHFNGPGTLLIQGNSSETTALHSNQAVVLDFMASQVTPMSLYVTCMVEVKFIKMNVKCTAGANGIYIQECPCVQISSNFLNGDGYTNGYGMFSQYSKLYAFNNYIDFFYSAFLNNVTGVIYATGNGTVVNTNNWSCIAQGATFTAGGSYGTSRFGTYTSQGAQIA